MRFERFWQVWEGLEFWETWKKALEGGLEGSLEAGMFGRQARRKAFCGRPRNSKEKGPFTRL